jgi:hypothetical protein
MRSPHLLLTRTKRYRSKGSICLAVLHGAPCLTLSRAFGLRISVVAHIPAGWKLTKMASILTWPASSMPGLHSRLPIDGTSTLS